MRLPVFYCTETQERIPLEYFTQGKAVWCDGKPYLAFAAKQLGLTTDSVPPAKYAALIHDSEKKASSLPPTEIELPPGAVLQRVRGKTRRHTKSLTRQAAAAAEMNPPAVQAEEASERKSATAGTTPASGLSVEPLPQAQAAGKLPGAGSDSPQGVSVASATAPRGPGQSAARGSSGSAPAAELQATVPSGRRAEEIAAEVKAAFEARQKAEAEEKTGALAAAKAREEAEARDRSQAEARAKAEDEARAKEEALGRVRAAEEARGRAEAAAKARAEAEAQARVEAEARARQEAEALERANAEARARAEAEAKARDEALGRARAAEEGRARVEAAAKAKALAEAKARAEAEERAHIEAEARARAEAEARAKAEAEDKAREEAEARARAEAGARARKEAEAREKAELEEIERIEAEARARIEKAARARVEAQARAKARAEAQTKAEAEARALAEAAAKAREEAEARAQAEAEARARAEAQAKAQEEAEARARLEAEVRAREEAEELARAEAEAKAREEAEIQARAEAEARARAETEARAKAEEEARARLAAEARARTEAAARAQAESEAKAQEEAAARAQAESEAQAQEEAVAQAKAEEEARARKEAEAIAREEAVTVVRATPSASAKAEEGAREKAVVVQALEGPETGPPKVRKATKTEIIAKEAGSTVIEAEQRPEFLSSAPGGQQQPATIPGDMEGTVRSTPDKSAKTWAGPDTLVEPPPVVAPETGERPRTTLPTEELRNAPGFEDLSEGQLQKLSDESIRRVYSKGETICRAGDRGFTAFYVVSGRAEVSLAPIPHGQALTGRRKHTEYVPIDGPADLQWDNPLGEVQAGELFGEMTCLTNVRRSATMRALEDCVILELLPQALLMLREHQPFMARLAKNYCAGALKQHLRNMPVLKDLKARLLEQLCAKVELVEFDPGVVIFGPGADFDVTYIIRCGCVKASLVEDGAEWVVTYLRRGDCFGKLAPLLSGGPGATYKTISIVSAARLKWEDVEAVLWEDMGSTLRTSRHGATPPPQEQTCENCADPRCMPECPIGGVERNAAGAATFDELCLGCGTCADNCPSGQIILETAPGADPDSPKKARLKPKQEPNADDT
ncbi:MAG: cyclic nucleotide-binding domain-containing protein [Planctomycetota bacterium]